MELQHFAHEHPFILKEEDPTSLNQTLRCKICCLPNFIAPFYACDLCQHYVHKSCAELPQYLFHHPKHPFHTLMVSFGQNYYKCNSCESYYTNSPTFTCFQCDFHLDVKCAIIAPITIEKVVLDLDDQTTTTIIQHSTHLHPLSLISDGSLVYTCNETCWYFLHESCAEFPTKIQYPFHLNHSLLTLHVQYFNWLNDKCNLCNKSYTTLFIFKCNECSFQLCLKCVATKIDAKGSIKYRYHEHLLCFALEGDILVDDQCSSYDSYCKQSTAILDTKEFCKTSPYAFYCLECNFKSHLLCGPLPFIIKYEYHIHSLFLLECLTTEEGVEDYYCDVCEMERDPRIRVYYCASCKYAAHVHCLIQEVINIFKGGRKLFRIMGEDLWSLEWDTPTSMEEDEAKSPSILIDIMNALPQSDKDYLKKFYVWDDSWSKIKGQPEKHKHSHNTIQSNLEDEDVNWILELSSLEYNLDHFVKTIVVPRFSRETRELKAEDLGLKLVTVEGYKIPHIVASVFKRLLSVHGDISLNCDKMPSKEGRSVLYFILCRILKKMGTTKIADITIDLMTEWFYNIEIVKDVGFEVDFVVFYILSRIVPAFFGTQAKRLEHEIPAMINKRMEKLQQEMIKLKSQLEICKDFPPKSEFMKECLAFACQKKWSSSCEGLL
ncbi:hypothetical protein F8388_008239 [Cannabis sativa]|uniref:DC1 domain-containing protein n=1 Tax=Cannabis sativa TaxID=3483 RepID=A0A7J6EVH9_CANSA|nr:hypothetical protein F8388_008239 [Cannabis sativa]